MKNVFSHIRGFYCFLILLYLLSCVAFGRGGKLQPDITVMIVF